MIKLIVNVETGEETLRELNDEELKQMEIDAANSLTRQAEAAAKAAERQAILDRLGLTVDELQTILG